MKTHFKFFISALCLAFLFTACSKQDAFIMDESDITITDIQAHDHYKSIFDFKDFVTVHAATDNAEAFILPELEKFSIKYFEMAQDLNVKNHDEFNDLVKATALEINVVNNNVSAHRNATIISPCLFDLLIDLIGMINDCGGGLNNDDSVSDADFGECIRENFLTVIGDFSDCLNDN